LAVDVNYLAVKVSLFVLNFAGGAKPDETLQAEIKTLKKSKQQLESKISLKRIKKK
jgi:hypothetical protein